jgi:hypothetical protein
MQKTSLAFVALLVSACTDPAPQRDEIETGPPLLHLVSHTDAVRGATTQLLDDETIGPVDLSGSPCACTTTECIDTWIQDNLSCGVIVDLVCDDGRRLGGGVLCSEPSPVIPDGAELSNR